MDLPDDFYAPIGKPDFVEMSSGCIFCDLNLPPVKLRRRWVHHIRHEGRLVACEVRNLKRGST